MKNRGHRNVTATKSETPTCFYEQAFIREFMELRRHQSSRGLAVQHHSAQRVTVLQLKANKSPSVLSLSWV